jgi:hypothetical protein
MQKIFILLLLIIQVGISTVLAQEPQQTETNQDQEFEVFPEQIEIVHMELGDSTLLQEIESTFNLARKTVKELEVRQVKNNSIIEDGNKQITSLNEFAKKLHDLVHVYYGGDTSKRAELLKFLKLDNSTNDTALAIVINSRIEEMKLEGKIINNLQDKSIEQNIKDKKFCDELIVLWKAVMRNMKLYFSEKDISKNDRENAKAELRELLTSINQLCD